MRIGVIFILIFSFITAHGSLITPTERLILFVNQVESQTLRYGIPVQTEDERRLGVELVELVHQNILATAIATGDPSRGKKIWEDIKAKVISKLNVLKLGRWMLATTRKLGPAFGVAVAVAELSRHALLFYVVLDPKMAFLLPLNWFRTFDLTVYGFFFGVPEIHQRLEANRRFGGGKEGVDSFYQFILQQRQKLPYDWSHVVDVESMKLTEDDGTQVDLDLAILKKSKTERYLPENLQKLIFPRRMAQRKSQPSLSINEIEKIAKSVGIELYFFKGFKISPALYGKLLIAEIAGRESGPSALIAALKQHSTINGDKEYQSSFVDASDILLAKTEDDLVKLGESPDILAERLIWYLDDRLDNIRQTKNIRKTDYKILRSAARVVNRNLRTIAETPWQLKPNGYSDLLDQIGAIRGFTRGCPVALSALNIN